ncbi:MAG: pyridoxal-phosphate dependent enzyme, partial [Deltaproteobacteria bacterium]|nr:pyridoxal-phosphate dependent enzyme [Deltaproteobacteria bacterium]
MLRGSQTVAEAIGNTPLIRLNRLTQGLPDSVEVYAKAEWMNPGGSVKDRAARGIVLDALEKGQLAAGGVLLDASSGNTGIAYAMLAPALGFKLKLCLPSNANEERKKTLRAYGAELILTDPALSSDGAILKARELSAANPSWFYADQYNNDSNWQAHY